MQEVDRYHELYLTEQERRLGVEKDLKDSKVFMFFQFLFLFNCVSNGHHSNHTNFVA